MDTSTVYLLLQTLLGYVKPADKEEAMFAALDVIIDEDAANLTDLRSCAEEDEEDCMVKCITKYIKENYGEEEEEEW